MMRYCSSSPNRPVDGLTSAKKASYGSSARSLDELPTDQSPAPASAQFSQLPSSVLTSLNRGTVFRKCQAADERH